MGEGHGAISVGGLSSEKDCEWTTHDLTTTDDDGVLSTCGNFAKAKNFHDSRGGAGKKAGGIPEKKLAEVHRVEAVHILGGGYAGIHLLVG